MQRTSKPAHGVGRLALCLVVALVATGPAAAQHGAPANGEWPTYGGDLGSTKYSPLDQIDRGNFGDIEIAWRWQSADAVLSLTMPDGSEWRADSRLIFAELNRRDPQRWRGRPAAHHHQLQGHPADGRRPALHQHADVGGRRHRRADGRDAVGFQPQELRGRAPPRCPPAGTSAAWPTGRTARTGPTSGSSSAPATAISSASTRRPGGRAPTSETAGRLDLMADIPRATRGERDWLNALLYSVQSPPIVFGDTVVTPMSISSYNIRKEMPPGWMRGFDVQQRPHPLDVPHHPAGRRVRQRHLGRPIPGARPARWASGR